MTPKAIKDLLGLMDIFYALIGVILQKCSNKQNCLLLFSR